MFSDSCMHPMSTPTGRVRTHIILGLLLMVGSAQAQGFAPVVTANVGAIEIVNRDLTPSQFTFYPEVEATIQFLQLDAAGISFSGGVYAGGWRYAVDEPPCPHCTTLSTSSVIVGTRIAFSLDEFPLPLSFRGGIARHMMSGEYVEAIGGIQHNYSEQYSALEAGVRLQIPVFDRLRIGADTGFHIAFPDLSDERYPARLQYALATSYRLR